MTRTRIGPGQVITGDVRAGEDLSIHGRVRGQIEAEGLVIIEAGAVIEAGVRAREVIVRGVVVGDVHAVDLLEVTANGQVAGSVQTKRLKLHAGGRIAGVVATGTPVQGFHFSHRRGSATGSTLRTGAMAATPRASRPTTPPSPRARSSSFATAPRAVASPLSSRATPAPTPLNPAADIRASDSWTMDSPSDERPPLDPRRGDDDPTILDRLPAFPSIDDTRTPAPAGSDLPERTPPVTEEHVEVTSEPPGEVVETDAASEHEAHEPS
ncbi:MAG: hypothetical protein CSA66_05700 [Proteobacteria bacterium]|nr:MAG: hypothetical protein CSA66_05700 [Pseudomonadota bacterium]